MHFHSNRTSIYIWIGLGVILIWRQLLKVNKVQVLLHRGPSWLAIAGQWQVLFCAGCSGAVAHTLLEFLWKYSHLDYEEVKDNLLKIYNAPCNAHFREKFEKDVKDIDSASDYAPEQYFVHTLSVPSYLYICNFISMCLGPLVLLVVSFHVYRFIMLPLRNLALEHSAWRHIEWAPTKRANWLLVIICMPLAFGVAVMRANIRLWQLLTGHYEDELTEDFSRVETAAYAAYFTDLEIAALFQFCCVWCFARITGAVLSDTSLLHHQGYREPLLESPSQVRRRSFWWREWPAASSCFEAPYMPICGSPPSAEAEAKELGAESEVNGDGSRSHLDREQVTEDYKTTILYAGFLGVWSYVAVGSVRSLLDLVFCIFRSRERFSDLGETLWTSAYGTMTSIFSVFTIQLIINMLIICHSPIVKHKIPGASIKFLGTRMLLLVLDVQQKVLDFFVYGNILYDIGDKHRRVSVGHKHMHIHNLKHSDEISKMKNLTLLQFWILSVAILNLVMWHKLDLQHAGFAKFKPVPSLLPASEGVELSSNSLMGRVKQGIDHTSWLFHKDVVEKHDDDPWDF